MGTYDRAGHSDRYSGSYAQSHNSKHERAPSSYHRSHDSEANRRRSRSPPSSHLNSRQHRDQERSWHNRDAYRDGDRRAYHRDDDSHTRSDRRRWDDRPRSPVTTPSRQPALQNNGMSAASTSSRAPTESRHAAESPAPSAKAVENQSRSQTDDQAKLAKKARLEAWRKEQAAKKALEQSQQTAKAQAEPTAFAPHSKISSAAAAPAAKSTSINATGLRGMGLRQEFNKGKAELTKMMDDVADSHTKKRMSRFDDLPPLDPNVHQGSHVGPNLDLGDDEEEASSPNQPMQIDNEEEEDPLDAFMSTVKTTVAKVNEQDRLRVGSGPSQPRAVILGGEQSDQEDTEDDELDDVDRVGMATEDLLALAAKKIKKKELPTVDHSSVDYEPFRKDFYHPPAEVEAMTKELADQIRLEMGAIVVRGKDCPNPLTKWSHCGLPASCLDVIKRLGYAAPTPIQSQAIPAIMSGRDIIGVAKTGSGKTMAFLLPMFRHIKDQRPIESMEGPIGIIMTPTRELAVQIYREMRPFIRALGLRAACVYGGAPISEQIAEMKKTADIVVATPGRLIDLLTANSGRVTNLRRVTYLVLDEADRMFDMGFEPQVMKIVNNVRPDRQTVLFSATFPKQMESLARKVLKNRPVEITVGGRSVVAAEIEQIVEVRPEVSKFNRLLEILGDLYNREKDARTLIFVDRQEAADDLLNNLIRKGYVTMSLHGGKDQVDRDETIQDFKAGNVPIVTATSVAARGLDVKQLKLVINYDVPNHMEDYVHRAGRTGRAGQKGTCITFITPDQERFARDIIAALKASKANVPAELEAMAESFKDKLATGKAKAAGSGFGGRGLEQLETDREKTLKAQKSAYGETDEDGKTIAGDTDEAKGSLGASDEQLTKLQSMKIEIMQGAAPEAVRDNRTAGPTRSNQEHSATKADQEQDAKEAAQLKAQGSALEAAKAHGADTTKLAAVLDNIRRQGNLRRGASKTTEADQLRERKARDPDATDYHAIVPINDFPQRARWRVTNKETMSHLIESTGASITNKGVFYKEGTEPEPGEPPKLALLIESNNKAMVEDAVREIQRLLVEATQAALEAEARNPGTTGRYSVV